MVVALAVIVFALAGCSVLTAARSRPRSDTREHLRGFLYVGATALLVLAVAVVVLGHGDNRLVRAEGLALFGLFTYVLYLLVACAVLWLTERN